VDKSIIDAPEDKLVSTKVDKKDKNGKLGKKKRQVIRKRMQQRYTVQQAKPRCTS